MNWHERIDAAEKRGSFTDEDQDLANNWVTCPCGEQDPRIPRAESAFHSCGMPLDDELADLGADFSDAVDDNDFIYCRTLLGEIEVRAAIILKEIGAST